MDAFIGRIIRGCEFRERIGVGGYGAVYRAYQAAVNREVAIKVILPERAHSPDFAARFQAEARMVARLEHPHIVPLYEFWHDDEGTFLVMRLLRGGSLRDVLRKRRALSLVETARWLDPIAEALAVAHAEGVIHCDLKPNNILLDERGNAYLSDFGIARDERAHTLPNLAEGVLGSPAYLSPEQIRSRPLTPQSDIYSLGVTVYEVLAGSHPYLGLPVSTMVARHVNDPLPPLRGLRDDIPLIVDTIIQKATAKLPSHRYTHVTDFAADVHLAAGIAPELTRMRGGESALPSPESPEKTEASPRAALPFDTSDRNRHTMLRNVETFWIRGVLENALDAGRLINTEVQDRIGDTTVVDHPWNSLLKRPQTGDERLPRGTPIYHAFDRMNGKLLILGEPGSGKTTMLLELARDLLARAARDNQHPIPVVFNLASWSERRRPLADWLADELNARYQVPARIARGWIADDKLTLLLDGLDEVALAVREACVEAINAYRREHGFVDIVICSRAADYEALSNRLLLNGAVVTQPLDDGQIDRYLEGYGDETQVLRRALARDPDLREMARSPLMLNIMAQAYRGDTSSGVLPGGAGDDLRGGLFHAYIRRMLARRPEAAAYTPEETHRYLSWLAKTMQAQAQSVFFIEGMQPAWLTPSQHRRYQRYLRWYHSLAWGVPRGLLLGIILTMLGVPLGWLWGVLFFINGAFTGWLLGGEEWKRWWAAPLLGILIGVPTAWNTNWGQSNETIFLACLGASLTFTLIMAVAQFVLRMMNYDWNYITPVDQLRFNPRAVNPWVGIAGFISGVLLGAFDNTTLQLPPPPSAIWVGLTIAVFLMILSGMRSDRVATTTRPNEGIRRSLKHAARYGLVVGALALMITVLVLPTFTQGMMYGLINATALGYGVALIYGGFAAAQHGVLRFVLERDKLIPHHYSHFLDYAARLILLRKVGGGYIFVHRYLLEYFAAEAKSE